MIGLNYRAILLAAAVAMIASGCRGTDSSVPGVNGSPAAAVIVIGDNPAEFEPSVVTVKVGDTVEWSNTGGIEHSVAFMGGPKDAPPAHSGMLAPRATYRRTFTVPGTYSYACGFHIINGMTGKVVVVADSASR